MFYFYAPNFELCSQFLNIIPFGLLVIKAGVFAVLGHQLMMCAVLYNAAILENHNASGKGCH